MLSTYWISYHYTQDLNRPRQFKKKYERLLKTFPGKFHLLNVFESTKTSKEFKGNGIPAKKDEMTTQAHLEAIKRAKQEGYSEILIIEDKTSFPDLTKLKNFISSSSRPSDPNWKILYLGGYIEEHQVPNPPMEWVSGKSRSHFAYLVNLKKDLDLDPGYGSWGNQLHDLDQTYFHQPILVIPQYYDLSKGLMLDTAKGLSTTQIEETSDMKQIKLKMDWVEEKDLPKITLLSVLDSSRAWWPLLLMNLNNVDYLTKNMEWIILDLSQDESMTIEDLLPRKRGKEGGWHLKYLHHPELNGKPFLELVEFLNQKEEISHSFLLEFNPRTFYPVFSLHSRVKTALKYKKYGYFGSTEVQSYSVPRDQTYLIGSGDELEFREGTRLVCLKRDLEQKMRIPAQFVSRTLDYVESEEERLYLGLDKFPDYLQDEDFFSDLVLIIDDLRKEYIKKRKI